MAISATVHSPPLLSLPVKWSTSILRPLESFSFQLSPPNFYTKRILSVPSCSISAAPKSGGIAPAISLTNNALMHLNKMRTERDQELCLRIGVKQGGCSGMSYTLDFQDREKTRQDDSVMEYDGFVIVCDPKSLLFMIGMQLDFSDALIGGGFTFNNPNATKTCGCGKSFAANI